MKRRFQRRYQAALTTYLEQGPRARVASARGIGARGMGERARAAGLQILDVAKLHEEILVTHVLPGRSPRQRKALVQQAGIFFAEAITPIEKAPIENARPRARQSAARLNPIVEMLSQRTVELAASNLESARLQERLRRLSRQILEAQEEERKKISRELHDVIAQTLTGINVRLAALKKEASLNTKGLERNIARTQRLVERSVDIVHQFARELRPAVLDDLGLIPALHSFVKAFSKRTRIHVHLKVFAGVERLDIDKRTILYRVAQEALTNVARHAKASRAEVILEGLRDSIRMQIKDDGKSFPVQRVLLAGGSTRLGLLGMRERLEMVGGRFDVESAPGKGTTITAQIPLGRAARRESSLEAAGAQREKP